MTACERTEEDPLSRRRLRTWLRLLRVAREGQNRLRAFLRVEFDTTLPRFDVLAALHRSDAPVKMSALSKMLLVSNGNATTVVDRLEALGHARRVVCRSDKRVNLVALTSEGRAWFRDVAAAHEREVNRIFAGLDRNDLDSLRDVMRRAEGADAFKEREE